MWNPIQDKIKANFNDILKLILVGVIAFVSISLVSKNSDATKYNQEIAQWKQETTRVLATNDTLKRTVKTIQTKADSITQVATSYSSRIAQLRAAANQKRPTINIPEVQGTGPDFSSPIPADSLDDIMSNLLLSHAHDRAELLDTAVVLAEKRDSARVQTIQLLQLSNRTLLTANDSLSAALLRVPIYKEPKLLGFISLPSRRRSFAVGVISGVAGVLIVRNNAAAFGLAR